MNSPSAPWDTRVSVSFAADPVMSLKQSARPIAKRTAPRSAPRMYTRRAAVRDAIWRLGSGCTAGLGKGEPSWAGGMVLVCTLQLAMGASLQFSSQIQVWPFGSSTRRRK